MVILRPTPESLDTDVLIIGAGPAGLMAALTLSRLGIRVKLLDRRVPGETAGQADGIQPRTMEIWESLGIGAELKAVGSHIHRSVMYVPNDDGSGIKEASQTLTLPLDCTPHPYTLCVASSMTEGMLIRALAERGVIIDQPFVPKSMQIVKTEDDARVSYVEVTVAGLHEDYLRINGVRQADRGKLIDIPEAVKAGHVIRAKYVLGCDGARSWVRKAVGIALEGETTDLVWGVVEFTPETNFPTMRASNVIASPLSGGILHVPRENDTARVYIRLRRDPNTVAEGETQGSASQDSQEKIIESIEKAFLPYTMRLTNVTWCNEYKVGRRVASAFSSANCVFLLGDAVRTHSPMAGQGANGAMADACNLAWKLAYVLQGRANPDILDTYEAERRAHAMELMKFDRDIFEAFRPGVFTADAYINVRDQKVMFMSGVGVKCESRLTVPDRERVAPGLRIGERVPWAGITRHSDWTPSNLLDLMAYNGHFKLIILPGDIRDPLVAHLFSAFSWKLVESLRKDVIKFLDIFTVLDVPKETSCEGLHLPPAFRITENVYADEDGRGQAQQNGRLYESLNVRPDRGAAIVVRPDGITAMVTGVRAEYVDGIVKYLDAL
ncbi:hypothetical protein DAEQUDRAFT_729460 [Daedalea quercina L-15889]|uniref:FAD-binding domain-containing protein n=1 Tax=Daedalea quercina L-15889 TaxID=1314783 RepID=A0A165NK04_9APHY|nr:hypothetical protein DAEQUDRAFT_729460 [Daedalea quercina L-15889]